MQKVRIRRRVYGTLTPPQQRRLEKARRQVEKGLPELIRRNELRYEARKAKTFSGLLRRLVHRFPQSPMKIAQRAEINWVSFSDFLTGEKPLPSDAIDRLIKVLKLKLPSGSSRTAKAS